MGVFNVSLEYVLLKIRRYWKLYIIGILIGSTISFIYSMFSGKFVSTFSPVKSYLVLIFIGYLFNFMVINSFNTLIDYFRPGYKLAYTLAFNGLSFIFCSAFFELFVLGILDFMGFVFVSLLFRVSVNYIVIFLICIALASVSFITNLVFLPIYLKKRGEGVFTLYIVMSLITTLTPAAFSISSYWFYPLLVIYPPVPIFEEFRKFLLGKEVNIPILSLSMLWCLFLTIISYYVIKRVLSSLREGSINLY